MLSNKGADMKKHLNRDTMEKELRLTFPSPLSVQIKYPDKIFLKFWVFGENGETLYESPKLPMQGQANVRLPRHFSFHLNKGREAIEEKTKMTNST